MAFELVSEIWVDREITCKAELLLLLALASYANDDGTCWPSIKTLSLRTRTSRRNVQKMMDRLKAKGWVDVKENAGPKGCNLYTLRERRQRHPVKMTPPASSRTRPASFETCPPASPSTHELSGTEPLEEEREENGFVDSDESTPLLEDSESDSPEATEAAPQESAAAPPRRAPRMPPPRVDLLKPLETSRDAGTDEGAAPPDKTPATRQSQRKQAGQTADVTLETVTAAWNEMAGENGLPGVIAATAGRTKAFKARARDEFWRGNWKAALAQVPLEAWRLGGTDRGWRANFDWFLRPDTVAKLIEEQNAAVEAQAIGGGKKPGPTKPKSKFPVGSPEWEKEMLSR